MKKNLNSSALAFKKNSLVELNKDQIKGTEGGDSGVFILGVLAGYVFGEVMDGIYQYTNGDCGCP